MYFGDNHYSFIIVTLYVTIGKGNYFFVLPKNYFLLAAIKREKIKPMQLGL